MSQSKMSQCPQCAYEYDSTEHSQCPLCLGQPKEPNFLIRLARIFLGYPTIIKLGLAWMSLQLIYFSADFMWKSFFLNVLSVLVYFLLMFAWYKRKDDLKLELWLLGLIFIAYLPAVVLYVVIMNISH